MSFADAILFALIVIAGSLGWLRAFLVRREMPADLSREIGRAIRQALGDFSD